MFHLDPRTTMIGSPYVGNKHHLQDFSTPNSSLPGLNFSFTRLRLCIKLNDLNCTCLHKKVFCNNSRFNWSIYSLRMYEASGKIPIRRNMLEHLKAHIGYGILLWEYNGSSPTNEEIWTLLNSSHSAEHLIAVIQVISKALYYFWLNWTEAR